MRRGHPGPGSAGPRHDASAEVYVTSAYIDLADAGSVFLDKGHEGWKVSAAGCKPPAGDLPWECELEG